MVLALFVLLLKFKLTTNSFKENFLCHLYRHRHCHRHRHCIHRRVRGAHRRLFLLTTLLTRVAGRPARA